MTVFRLWGDEVVSKGEFIGLANSKGFESLGNPMREAIGENGFEEGADTGATQFTPIGQGRPLTILIRDVYTGKHPKSSFGSSSKPMAVVTALKDYATYAPSSRAINFLEKDIEAKTRMKAPAATSAGTNVVSYSPAVLSDALHYTVEMAFDTFPDRLFEVVAGAFKAASGIPLLMPAREYLLAAGGLTKVAGEWANSLFDGRPVFSVTDTLDFNVPGSVPPSADFRVLGGQDHHGLKYDPAKGALVNAAGEPYDGDSPYVVVSLDGAVRSNLENFAPTLATAEQIKQFFAAKDGAEASVEALLEGMKLANDMKYRADAQKLQRTIEREPEGTRKEAMKRRLEALRANILSEELQLAGP